MTQMSHPGTITPRLARAPLTADDDRAMIRRSAQAVTPLTCQDVGRALDHGELEVWYQPTVRLADAMVTGFEALVRWRHAEFGVLPAASFLPLAEECGLTGAVDERVRQLAFAQLAAWQEDAIVGPGFRMAVNVAASDLRANGLAVGVAAAIHDTGVDPRGLVLELTDMCRVVDVDDTAEGARRLHALGVAMALDDFGSQYATFELLRSLPLDGLTIDRAVVADCESPVGEAFTRAVVALAEALPARIVAGGVETARQADRLREAGCAEARGFLWSPAVPAAEAEQLLVAGWN
jgi:EAL domain-containing protein (putative c-di-GMP-specific phosphodiesterase class I)